MLSTMQERCAKGVRLISSRCLGSLMVALLCMGLAPEQLLAQDVEKVVDRFEVGNATYVRSLLHDKNRNALWVGTSVGAMEIDLKTNMPRKTFTRKDGLANEYVFGLGIDSMGYTWFGTNAGGASRYKDGKWKTYFPMHGLADYWIYSFANDKNGNLWIGTWAGANLFNVKTGKFTTYVKELVNEWVYGLGVDKDGRVWFGTEGGVSMFDGKRWKSWTHKDGLGAENPEGLSTSANTGLGTRSRHDLTTEVQGMSSYNPNYVFSIHVANDGSIWAGTWGGGVSRWDGKKWSNLSTKNGLAGNIVYSMAQDDKGVFWFGTDRGLSRFDGTNWRTIGIKDGLLDEHVYAIALTPGATVWAGTKRGVVRIAAK
jgi:ligand-binding sensor domain-containing protein